MFCFIMTCFTMYCFIMYLLFYHILIIIYQVLFILSGFNILCEFFLILSGFILLCTVLSCSVRLVLFYRTLFNHALFYHILFNYDLFNHALFYRKDTILSCSLLPYSVLWYTYCFIMGVKCQTKGLNFLEHNIPIYFWIVRYLYVHCWLCSSEGGYQSSCTIGSKGLPYFWPRLCQYLSETDTSRRIEGTGHPS